MRIAIQNNSLPTYVDLTKIQKLLRRAGILGVDYFYASSTILRLVIDACHLEHLRDNYQSHLCASSGLMRRTHESEEKEGRTSIDPQCRLCGWVESLSERPIPHRSTVTVSARDLALKLPARLPLCPLGRARLTVGLGAAEGFMHNGSRASCSFSDVS